MGKKITDTSLPDVWACEDTIFNICMDEINEFPQYLTNIDDIQGRFPKKHLSEAYNNLEVDFVRKRKDEVSGRDARKERSRWWVRSSTVCEWFPITIQFSD